MDLDLTERKINIALLGGGKIASNHIQAISSHSNELNLVAVCDKNETTLNSFQVDSSIKKYNDYEEMLNLEKLDIISICTPSGLHPKQAIQASNKSLNVITEKPMAINFEDGLNMVNISKKNGTKLFVVKQNRYNKFITLLKEVIEKDILGKVYLVQSNVFWTRPQSYYDEVEWRGTKKHDGGALMNQACHYIDLLYWLFGPVSSVNAITSTTRKIETEDTGVLNLNFKTGALGTMSYSMLTYPHNYEGSITVIAENGTVKIGGPSLSRIETWNLNDKSFDDRVSEVNLQGNEDKSEGHVAYYNNVIETLRGKAKPLCDGREGLKSLEILEATYLSSDSGKTVFIPLEN